MVQRKCAKDLKRHWANPVDIKFQPGHMRGRIGGFGGEDSVVVAMIDGSVRRLNLNSLDDDMLDQLIMPADGTEIRYAPPSNTSSFPRKPEAKEAFSSNFESIRRDN